jgi:hypothetical protein
MEAFRDYLRELTRFEKDPGSPFSIWLRYKSELVKGGLSHTSSLLYRDCKARAFVGGSEYFPVLADVMVAAEREILIADWWLTPEIYLKREGELKVCESEK